MIIKLNETTQVLFSISIVDKGIKDVVSVKFEQGRMIVRTTDGEIYPIYEDQIVCSQVG